MRTLFTAPLLIASLACLGQGKTIRPEPHWNYLDRRNVTTTVALKMTVNDSSFMETTSRSSFTISVPDLRKEYFVITTKTDQTDDMIGNLDMQVAALPKVQQDSILRRIREVMSALYEPLMKMETSFKVDRTGKVIELLEQDKNKEEMRAGILEAVKNIQVISRENKRHTSQELEAKASHMVDSLYDSFAQVQVNNMNLVLEPYAYNFPMTGSVRQQAMVTDVNAPMMNGMGDLPAIIELGLDELTEKTLVARIVTTYDAEAVLKRLVARDPNTKLKKQDISLVEESVYSIDRGTGWLTRSTSEIRLRIEKIRMVVNTLSVLEVVKP
ncbi:MAG: hypothetical protein IPO90_09020 [Flavobacteriales bacterium]|nr:hypothetical protein [Flavobacteriales bacterium]